MTPTPSRLADALAFACDIHDGQFRKGSQTPYVSHLLATAAIAMDCGGGENVAIAALLHDALEDQPHRVSLPDIKHRFGADVATIVAGVTEPPKTESWADRKAAYYNRLESESAEAILVSFADKAHNLSCLAGHLSIAGAPTWSRFNASPEAIVSCYERLIDLYDTRLRDEYDIRATLGRMVADIKRVRRYLD